MKFGRAHSDSWHLIYSQENGAGSPPPREPRGPAGLPTSLGLPGQLPGAPASLQTGPSLPWPSESLPHRPSPTQLAWHSRPSVAWPVSHTHSQCRVPLTHPSDTIPTLGTQTRVALHLHTGGSVKMDSLACASHGRVPCSLRGDGPLALSPGHLLPLGRRARSLC